MALVNQVVFIAVLVLFCEVRGDSGCTSIGGTCQKDNIDCPGRYRSGLCSGPRNRRCCLNAGDSKCTSVGGTCQNDNNNCRGKYRSGLCSGPANIRCCLNAADNKCTNRGGSCQTDSNRCSGEYRSGLCSGPADRRCCIPGGSGRLTNSQALKMLKDNNISWRSSGNCNNKHNRRCTSFTGMRRSTLDGLVAFKNDLPIGCPVTVTGGTERGHARGTFSHSNGYKIDIRLQPCIYSYITSSYKRIADRADNSRQWRDSDGNIYALESHHWDITYF